jgi:predicted DNA-binding helix-hairpin-helix protein
MDKNKESRHAGLAWVARVLGLRKRLNKQYEKLERMNITIKNFKKYILKKCID